MKVIIAGSRDIERLSVVRQAIAASGFRKTISEVVCGMASGVDLLGAAWARLHEIPVIEFPADWAQFGKSAGYKRNVEMAAYADALIAVWDGTSRGTKHMIDIARREGLRVFVYRPKEDGRV